MENYDTRLSRAMAIPGGLVNVQYYNERQIHSIVALEQQGKFYLKLMAGKSTNLGGDYRSLVIGVSSFDQQYLSAIGKAISHEQTQFPNSGPLERENSYIAQLITSGKMPLMEARGFEFQDQNWSVVLRDRDIGFSKSYFLKCCFRSLSAQGTDFSFAQFRGCEFSHSVNFSQAKLCCSIFSEQCLFDDTFYAVEADFSQADFGDAILKGDFSKADLRQIVADSFRTHKLDYNTASFFADMLGKNEKGTTKEQLKQDPLWLKTYEQLHRPVYYGAEMDRHFYQTLRAIGARSSFSISRFFYDLVALIFWMIVFAGVAVATYYLILKVFSS